MCLHTISKKHTPPLEKKIVGYKIFEAGKIVDNKVSYVKSFFTCNKKKYKTGKWIKDSSTKVLRTFGKPPFSNMDRESYNSGFHAYTDIEKAGRIFDWIVEQDFLRSLVLLKVEVSDIETEGTEEISNIDENDIVVVARKMYIHPNIISIERGYRKKSLIKRVLNKIANFFK